MVKITTSLFVIVTFLFGTSLMACVEKTDEPKKLKSIVVYEKEGNEIEYTMSVLYEYDDNDKLIAIPNTANEDCAVDFTFLHKNPYVDIITSNLKWDQNGFSIKRSDYDMTEIENVSISDHKVNKINRVAVNTGTYT